MQSPSTDIQPSTSTNQAVEDLVRACMSSITPIIETTCRRVIEEKLSTAEIPVPQTIASSDPPPVVPTTDQSTSAEASPTLLQEMTATGSTIPHQISKYGQNTYTGSSLSCQDLTKTVDVLIRNSLSKSTVSAYKATYLNYQNFVIQFFGPTEQPLPPSLKHLTAFIAHCNIKGLAASTTRTFISSLSFIFQLGNYQDISQTFLIKKMLKGFHKSKPTTDPRLPITPEILSSLLQSLEHTTSSFFTKLLLKAMFILAFCAFLRIGEITKTPNPTQHFLLFGNVFTGLDEHQNGYVEINIPHFKHAKSNTTTLRLHQNKNNPCFCPYQSMHNYLKVRKHASPSDPLFSFMDNTPISKQYFTQQLRLALSFCNFDLNRYQSHSFRIGAATTAAARGFSELQIQTMGRWNSNAFRKYIRIPALQF